VNSRQGSSFFRVFPGFCRIGRLSNSRSNLAKAGISDVWESDLTSDNYVRSELSPHTPKPRVPACLAETRDPWNGSPTPMASGGESPSAAEQHFTSGSAQTALATKGQFLVHCDTWLALEKMYFTREALRPFMSSRHTGGTSSWCMGYNSRCARTGRSLCAWLRAQGKGNIRRLC